MSAPDNNPKTAQGRKKPPVHAIPPSAILHLGSAMENGEGKYGLMNWREKRVSSSVYYDAAMRHLMSWWDGEDHSRDTTPPVHHLAHVLACLSIILDAMETGNLNDDRPIKGVTADLIDAMQLMRIGASENPRPVQKPDPDAPKPLLDWTGPECQPHPTNPRPRRGFRVIAGNLYFEDVLIADLSAVQGLIPSAQERLAELVFGIEGDPAPGDQITMLRDELRKAQDDG